MSKAMEDGVTMGSMVMDTGAHDHMEHMDHNMHHAMNHSGMDHGSMDHSMIDHSKMNRSMHGGSGQHLGHSIDAEHSMKVLYWF